MITPLDRYPVNLADASSAEMAQMIQDLEQDVEMLEWEVEWRQREIRAARSAIAQVRVRLWQAPRGDVA